MNLLKRTQINILRNSSKSLLLLVLTILLGIVVSAALIVTQAIEQTTRQARQNLPSIATIAVDIEAVLNAGDAALDIGYVDAVTLNEIAALPYVLQVDESLIWGALTRYDTFWPDIESDYFIRDENLTGNLNGEFNQLRARGVSHVHSIHLTKGLFTLVNGRLFDANELEPQIELFEQTPVIIPRTFAELNHLAVGSLMTLYIDHFQLPEGAEIPEGGFYFEDAFNHPYNNWINVPYHFVVIGIVDVDYTIATHQEAFLMQEVVYNTIFMPNWKIESIWREQFPTALLYREIFNDTGRSLEDLLTPTVFFVIDDGLNLASFRVAADALLPEFYRIDTWEQVVTPLETGLSQIRGIVQNAMRGGIVAMGIILVLLLSLFIHERRYEMGVYIALGQKKRHVFLQLMIETVVICSVGMLIAVWIGNLIADEVNQHMIRTAITQEDIWRTGTNELFSELEFQGIGRELTVEELVDFFDVSLNVRTILMFFLIGIGTVISSLAIASYFIFKLNVKNLLMRGKIG
ncbi:MAG: FtsX-like permease family protein [Defluviitaleaceae bacterium]|nr:FtsX-like permease family protein [Defluviitaleaceae bacterium]